MTEAMESLEERGQKLHDTAERTEALKEVGLLAPQNIGAAGYLHIHST